MGKKNFVAGILDRKPMIILIMILVLIGGLVSYVMIPKQHFPKVIVPVAAVSVVYPGASAEELEELVAKPVDALAPYFPPIIPANKPMRAATTIHIPII